MEFIMNAQALFLAGSVVLVVSAMTFGGSLQAPPGLFKDLNDEILGDAIILNGKQLFFDDVVVDEQLFAVEVDRIAEDLVIEVLEQPRRRLE